MVDATHIKYEANDRSYFFLLKKDIYQQAEGAGFDKKKLNNLNLVLCEMTSNLHKYAKDGEILCGLFNDGNNQYLELICIDNGPGMADAQKMMTDGYSSADTLGLGLGSIKRLSDQFDIFSQKGWGTILLSRIYKNAITVKTGVAAHIEIHPLVICMPGEQKSGDGFYYKLTEQYFKLLVADGLGHGPEANQAVREAVNAFKVCPYTSPAEIIKFIHGCTKKTRGMVGAVVVFDFASRQWNMAGVGNITTRMSDYLDIKNQMSYNGIIGHNIPNTITDQKLMLADFHQITLCSDGIKSQWEKTRLVKLQRCDLSLQAAAIYKDFARQTDDMMVIIAKVNPRLCN